MLPRILWLACRYGNFKICQAFVAKCRWVGLTPLWGRALFLACAFGHCEIVALLLEKGFALDLVHYGEYSALAMACACNGGHCEVVKLLLGRGADVDAAIDGESVLVSALKHEHTEVVRPLLERGAQVDLWDPEVARLLLDRGAEVGLRDCVNGKSILMIASEYGQCEVVKLLLDAGAQVDLHDKVGRTAIVLASKHGHGKVGVLLLERMAEVDNATLSAIMSAVMVKCKLLLKQQYLGHINFLKYVEELSKRVSLTECYQEILWLACWCGNFKICQAFVAKCRWVGLTPLWGRALILACAFGHCEIVALLLERGFPQDLVHYGEYSALAMACACNGGHCEVVKLLLGRGADVDAAIDGESVLVSALKHEHTEVVRPLLERGAQVDLWDPEVARLLLDRGAEVGLRDCVNGKSILMIASEYGQCEVVKLLLDAGAQVDLHDKVGRTAIVLASKHGHGKVGVLLLERMAEVDNATLSAIMSAVMVKCKLLLKQQYLGHINFLKYVEELSKRVSLTECYQEILWLACWCGNFKICQAFVAKCRWVGLTPLWGRALILACAFGHCEIVALLLERGFPQDLVHYGEYSALAMACACNGGHCEVVGLLLGRGADVDAAIDGESVLVSALKHEHTEVVRPLLERGAQVDLWDPEVPWLLLGRGAEVGLRDCVNGKSALMIASECGQCEVVKLLLDAGAQVDLQDKVGRTAIVLASNHEHWKVGVLLLRRMAEVDSATLSAIMSAVIVKCKSLLREYLLEKEEYEKEEYEFYFLEYINELIESASLVGCYQEILWLACGFGNFKICQAFVAKCRWVELTPLWGRALFLACSFGHYEIVALLLERGFPQDLVHYGEYSALAMACACEGGHCEVVKLLLVRGADVDAAADSKHFQEILDLLCIPPGDVLPIPEFALVNAARGGHTEIVRLLLDEGARVGLHSAVTSAIQEGFQEVVELFMECCAEKDLFDGDGCSPLMFATRHGHIDTAKWLLDKGAEIDLQDISGRSAIMIASEYQHWDVGKLLIERGAEVDTTILSAFMSSLMIEHQDCWEPLNDFLNTTQTRYLKDTNLLIEKGALIDTGNAKACKTLLWLACVSGDFYIAGVILETSPWVEESELWCEALHLACSHGHYEIAELLLEKGFPRGLVHYGGVYSSKSLMGACRGGHCAVVKLLLEKGVHVDAVVLDDSGCSPLMFAAKHGLNDMAKLLLSKGAQVDLQDINGKSALNFACDMKHYEMAEILLRSGDHVKLEDQSTCLEMLWLACEGGNLQILRLILSKYPWVNTFAENGRSPLMFASERGFCEMASLLLDMGAQVDLQNSNGMSALMFCSNQEVAKLMLDSGAHVDLQDNAGRSALMFASKQGFFVVAKLCVDKGAQVDLQDNAGRSALAWACRYSFQEIDDLDELRLQYHSLAMSRYNENYKIAKLLLESGAKLALPSEGSLVRLYLSACKRGDCGVVELLLGAGVEVDVKVKYGMGSTGLMHASKGGHCELVELLLGRSSRVNQRYVDGKSSLMYASEGGHAEVVKLLLKAGAQPDMQAQFGVSAKKLAEERNRVDIVKLLEDPAKVSNLLATITSIADCSTAMVVSNQWNGQWSVSL